MLLINSFYFKIVIILFLGISMFGIILNTKIDKKVVIFLGSILIIIYTIIAFKTVPYQSDDLSRYFYMVDSFKGRSLSYVFKNSYFANTPVSNLLLYFVSLTGNKHLLPAIVVCFESIIYIYIIFCEKKRKNIHSRTAIMYILLSLPVVGIYVSVSGIRSNLACFIATVVIYNDFFCKKNKIWIILGYLILPLIHSFASVILLIRLLCCFKNVKKIRVMLIILPIVLVMNNKLLELVPIGLVQTISQKMTMYQEMIIVGKSLNRNIGYFLFMIASLIVYLKIEKSYSIKTSKKMLKYLNFLICYIMFCFGSYLILPEIFYRGACMVSLLSLPMFSEFRENIKNKILKLVIIYMYLLSAIIFYVYEYILYIHGWTIM